MAAVAKFENRTKILATYYKVPESLILALAEIPADLRKEKCREQGIDPYIFRTMMDYSRYPQAFRIHQKLLELRVPAKNFSVLDYGCLVADYGMYFARLGVRVALYDKRTVATDFARFRFAREKLKARVFPFPTDFSKMVKGRRLVIFGEVLEHLENPLGILQECVDQAVPFIYSSCYPFGDKHYFAMPGHSRSAEAQQADCIKLLKPHYASWILHKREVLWQRM